MESTANLEFDPQQVAESLSTLQRRVAQLESQQNTAADPNRLNLLVFESHRDRLLAAFVMATGAAACGMQVTMFFTFWATAALRANKRSVGAKSLVERAFGWMLPTCPGKTKLSQLDMCGLGRMLMSREMKKKNITDLNDLIETAAELGVVIRACEMSMQLMGIQRDELIDYPNLEFCGVAKFVEETANANTTMFI